MSHKRKRTPTYKRSHTDNDSSDETYYEPAAATTQKRRQTQRSGSNHSNNAGNLNDAASVLWANSANSASDKYRIFRASRAICLSFAPHSFVTISMNRWLPPSTGNFSSENGDHLWVPHSVPQVKQEKFKCVKVTGPAQAHVRLLEEKPEEGTLKFSIQGEQTHNERRGQIRTFSGYHIRISVKSRCKTQTNGKELFVMTKTNHVAAGPQVIEIGPGDSFEPSDSLDSLPAEEEETKNEEEEMEEQEEEENEDEEDEEEDEDDEEEEEVEVPLSRSKSPLVGVSSWPSPLIVTVDEAPKKKSPNAEFWMKKQKDEEQNFYIQLSNSRPGTLVPSLTASDDMNEFMSLMHNLSREYNAPPASEALPAACQLPPSTGPGFDVDSLLNTEVLDELCG